MTWSPVTPTLVHVHWTKLTFYVADAYITQHHVKYDRGESESVSIEFLVSDSGNGVLESTQETMWDPFVSTNGSTGLGLFVVKRCVSGCANWVMDVA